MTNWTHPLPNNVTGFPDLMRYTNNLTDQFFAPSLLLAIFAITFLSLNQYPRGQSFAAASFVTAVSSYLLYVIGLVAEVYVILMTILVVTSVFVSQGNTESRK